MLHTSRLVTLTGVGGSGKTRLALRAANEYEQSTGVTAWFTSLETVKDPHRIPDVVARSLAPGEPSNRGPAELVVDRLGRAPSLLVLDNCEHLLDAAASFVDLLLDTVPDLTVLATSRHSLGLYHEQVVPVPPLTLDPVTGGDLPEAVALLVARASAADRTFTVGPHDIPVLDEICRALDGLPLAIELAASWFRTLSPRDLAARLSSRFSLLRGSSRSSVERQKTLRAAVDWSFDLCTRAQRELWANLSVFSGPFDLAAATAVSGESEDHVLTTLQELIAQSLVEVDRTSRRFWLLETIRVYGRERAEQSGVRPALVRRHLNHYRSRTSEYLLHWYGPDLTKNFPYHIEDHVEIQSALEAASSIDIDTALGFFTDLRNSWGASGHLSLGRSWAERLLATPGASDPARVPALLTAVWLDLQQGDLSTARRRLKEAGSLATHLPQRQRVAAEIESHRWAGSLALFSGDQQTAREHFERSIARATRAGVPEEAMFAQFQLTVALVHLGLPDATVPASRARDRAESTGERWMWIYATWALALADFAAGALDDAEAAARDVLTIDFGFRDPMADCLLLELLAWIDAARGSTERTALILGSAGEHWRRLGSDISVHGPQMMAFHERCVESVVRELGRAAVDRLADEGARLTAVEAVTVPRVEVRPAGGLSAREWDVALGIHAGLSNREIAETLVLSVRTIDTHVQRIFAKLGVNTRAQIAAWGEAQGMGQEGRPDSEVR